MLFDFVAGYRIPTNSPACSPISTHYHRGQVEADSAKDAEVAAIVKTYADLGNDCEHVRPRVSPAKINSDF